MAAPKLDVCVVGLGAIGILYAYALERSGRVNVTAVCRSNYQILADEGVNIQAQCSIGNAEKWKPHRAVRNTADAADRGYAFVVCCFKALQDVVTTPDLLGPLLDATQTFVLVQNGVNIHHDLQTSRPSAIVISACAWVDATVVDDGKRMVQTGNERLSFGYHNPPAGNDAFSHERAKDAVSLLSNLLAAGGCTPEATEDITFQRWRKVLWNACFSTICTMSRGSMADFMSSAVDPERTTIPAAREIMREVIAVAYKSGVKPTSLDAAVEPIITDAIEQYADWEPSLDRKSEGAPATARTQTRVPKSNFKPSMLVDLEAGRPIEVEAIVGNVVRAGQNAGVDTPRLDLAYATLRVVQANLIRSRQ